MKTDSVNGGPDDGSVSRIVALMFRWPVDVFVTGVDLVVGGLQEFRAAVSPTPPADWAHARAAVVAALADSGLTPIGEWGREPVGPTLPGDASRDSNVEWTNQPDRLTGEPGQTGDTFTRRETQQMPVIDLGGDDIKRVTYCITFDKTDFVATLLEGKETIDYPTDEGSFGGLKMGRLFQLMQSRKILWPEVWGQKAPSAGFGKLITWVDGRLVAYLTSIPPYEQKHLRFNITLDWRRAPAETEREKDKVNALREISEGVKLIAGS